MPQQQVNGGAGERWAQPNKLSAYCVKRDLYREQVKRWRQVPQDTNEKPVLTLREPKELEAPPPLFATMFA